MELGIKVNIAESAYNAANPTRQKSNLTFTVSGEEKVAQINATLPVQQALNLGVPSFAATDYLGNAYTAFNGGSILASTHVIAAFLECAHQVQALELAFPENDRPNNVTIEYSSDAQSVTIACNLPVTESISSTDGAIKYTAVDYL